MSVRLSAWAAILLTVACTGETVPAAQPATPSTAAGIGSVQVPPSLRTLQPTPVRYPVRTAEDVLRGMATDEFVTAGPAGSTIAFDPAMLGRPLFVRALRAVDRDLWLVPTLGGLGTATPFISSVIVVGVGPDGLGAAGIRAGNAIVPPGLDVPPISEARAKVIASAVTTEVVAAELVWMRVLPIEGFLCDQSYPMWRLTSRNGSVVYVTGDGQLKTAVDIDRMRGG